MASTGAYGQSFAMKELERGNAEAALELANLEVERDPSDPEAVLDRAQVYLALERFGDAIADLEACRELDRETPILDDSIVDDTLVTALIEWGKRIAPDDPERAVALLGRYQTIMPDGNRGAELASWAKRFRGQTEIWVKPRS
jgi:hypothetical protein